MWFNFVPVPTDPDCIIACREGEDAASQVRCTSKRIDYILYTAKILTMATCADETVSPGDSYASAAKSLQAKGWADAFVVQVDARSLELLCEASTYASLAGR